MSEMSFVELETRLARLEERGAARDLAVARLETKTDAILERLTQFHPCPAVGSCVGLKTNVQDLEARTRSLEDTRTSQQGAWKFAVALGAALTATGGTIGALLSHWLQHPKP